MSDGLEALLSKLPDMVVVGKAEHGKDAVEMAEYLKPDIVIMDVEMPTLNGIDSTERIVKAHPNIKVIALSTHARGSTVCKMFKAGAVAYILKESAFSDLIEGIQTVMGGESYVCKRTALLICYQKTLTDPAALQHCELTSLEREIVQLIAEGHSSSAIASQLSRSEATVNSHRQRIMEKLGMDNIAAITKYALRECLTGE